MWGRLGGLDTQDSEEFKHRQNFMQGYGLHTSDYSPIIGGISFKLQPQQQVSPVPIPTNQILPCFHCHPPKNSTLSALFRGGLWSSPADTF